MESDGEYPLFLFEISQGFDEGISNVVVEDTVVGLESVVALEEAIFEEKKE